MGDRRRVARRRGCGDRRVLGRSLGDVADVRRQGVLQHQPERQQQGGQDDHRRHEPGVAAAGAASTPGQPGTLGGVGVEPGDDDRRDRRGGDRQRGEEDHVAGELAAVVASGAVTSIARSWAVSIMVSRWMDSIMVVVLLGHGRGPGWLGGKDGRADSKNLATAG